MYKSPITLQDYPDITILEKKINADLINKFEEYIMTEVTKTLGIEVDKEELIKALLYERDQYEAGFQEGYQARDKELVRCKECNNCKKVDDQEMWCVGRGYPSQLVSPEGFCDRGK